MGMGQSYEVNKVEKAFDFVRNDNLDGLRDFVENSNNDQYRLYYDKDGDTLLHKAILYKREEILKFLLSLNIESINNYNETPMKTIMKSQDEIMMHIYINSKIEEHEQEIDKLEKEQREYVNEINNLKTNLACVEQSKKALSEEYDDMLTDINSLIDDNDRYVKENEQIKSTTQLFCLENETLKTENEDLRKINKRQREENDGLEYENKKVKTENEQLKTDNETLQKDIQALINLNTN